MNQQPLWQPKQQSWNRLHLVMISLVCLALIFSVFVARPYISALAASPSITLTPNAGSPTTLTKVHGTGFKGSEMVSIDFDTSLLTTVTASSSGAIWVTIPVPQSAQPGNHRVLATGQSSGRSISAPFLVQTDWAMFGFSPHHTHFNPYENVLNSTNVSSLQGGKIAYFGTLVHSSPVVANGIVYTEAASSVYAYQVCQCSAQLLWSATIGYQADTTPAVANGIVYASSVNGSLSAFNATTGAPLWNYSTKAPIFYSSPAVANGMIYIGSQDDKFYAFNAKTGAPLWNYTTGGIITSSPTVANGVIYISSWDNHLYAFNAKTGAILWSTSIESQTESSPTLTNGMLFIGTSDDYLCLFNLPSTTP